MNIFLCGFKTCGKTTLAEAYHQAYGWDWLDTDHLMMDEYQLKYGQSLTIAEMHQELGEDRFRALESQVVHKIPASQNTLVALGGGSVLCPKNVMHLKSLGPILYLKVSAKTLATRWRKLEYRPTFLKASPGTSEWMQYFARRDKIYTTNADHIISATGQSIEQLVSLLYEYGCQYGK